MRALLADESLLAIMPTGAGKSLCYQLPAMLLDGVTLVVSPLIALMKDQVDALQARGLPATLINSSVPPRERQARIRDVLAGRYKLVYVAPERFKHGFVDRLKGLDIGLFVVDEAHCISWWGHDFRPDYSRLGEVAKALGARRVAAFTATATADVRQDIIERLSIESRNTYVFGFHRANLRFDVVPISRKPQKMALIQRYLRNNPEQAGIIYTATRKSAEAVAAELARARIDKGSEWVGFYHGGLEAAERRRIQDRFMEGRTRVMVATNAFGMGVDRADIRFVTHYELPGSVEALYQEAGRAGRDGRPALCTLLFTYADTAIHDYLISKRERSSSLTPEEQQKRQARDEARLRELTDYAYGRQCRHAYILDYFGESLSGACGACDHCLGEAVMSALSGQLTASARRERANTTTIASIPVRPMTPPEAVVVQKVLSAVARTAGTATSTAIAQALTGESTPQVVASPLVGTRSHGILKGWSRRLLTELIEALGRAKCLARVTGTRSRYELTELGTEVMWRRRAVSLSMPPFGAPDALPPARERALSERDDALYAALLAARDELARKTGVPTYSVCTDATLRRIARARPVTAAELLRIKGVRPASEAKYGEIFRRIVKGEPEDF